MGPKRLVLEIRWKMHGEIPFGWRHCDGCFVFEPCNLVESHIWQGRGTLAKSTPPERRGYHIVQVSHDARGLFLFGPSRLVIRCRLSGTRNQESDDEGPRGIQTCWGATCEGDQLEQLCLNHKPCKEFWRCSATQTMLETWNAHNLFWNGSRVVITLDQACDRHGAKHHGGQQWRVWMLHVAQIFSPKTRNQCNAE